jgi:beta-glucosidase/6-phospho-beta-glucosidase/beta-galactosidase
MGSDLNNPQQRRLKMTRHPGIFPTFFLSGFECSTFCWKDHGRRDLVDETHHRAFLEEDYQFLRELGIAVSREGIPWPMVDTDGAYDFSRLDPVIEVMNRCQILPIWDLCHYGYPDGLDPFSLAFAERFARYCRAAAEYVIPRMRGPHFFTPINEISFFADCGGAWGWVAPYKKDEESRKRLRYSLCRAAIAGVRAIREVAPEARMVHVDPLVQIVAPEDRPDLVEEAREKTFVDTFYAWDIIAGQRHPELGGSPEILDIVGVNCYAFGQMEYSEAGPHKALKPNAEGIVPLCDLLSRAWEKYRRPIIVAETSGLGEGRPAWLKDVMEEALAAVDRGIDLHGICLYPAVDMPNWHTGEWLNMGIADLVEENGRLRRVPYQPYVDELRRWQKLLNRVTVLDEDPFDNPVELADVVEAARRLRINPDQDWS